MKNLFTIILISMLLVSCSSSEKTRKCNKKVGEIERLFLDKCYANSQTTINPDAPANPAVLVVVEKLPPAPAP